jgi:hypothetical protein
MVGPPGLSAVARWLQPAPLRLVVAEAGALSPRWAGLLKRQHDGGREAAEVVRAAEF